MYKNGASTRIEISGKIFSKKKKNGKVQHRNQKLHWNSKIYLPKAHKVLKKQENIGQEWK